MEKTTLLGSSRARDSSPSSVSAEMANLGSRAGREPRLVLSVSEEWDREGLREMERTDTC